MAPTPVSWRAVNDDVLEARPPDVSAALAAEIARAVFGLEGEATPLEGERDRNFRLDTEGGSYVLKVGNPADAAGPPSVTWATAAPRELESLPSCTPSDAWVAVPVEINWSEIRLA